MRNLWAMALVVGFASQASAQPVFVTNPLVASPYSRPLLSPYLNLLRGGDPAANYYMGVLPEYNARATSLLADYNYRFNLTQSSQPTSTDPNLFADGEQLSPTGHPTAFMYYNGHFQVPNTRSFIPFNPGQARGPQRR